MKTLALAVVAALSVSACTKAPSTPYVRFQSADATASACYATCAQKPSRTTRTTCYRSCTGTRSDNVDECTAQARPATACERRGREANVVLSVIVVAIAITTVVYFANIGSAWRF